MRGKKPPVRKLAVDETYGSDLVTKLINYIMVDGKKGVARTLVYKSLEDLGSKTKTEPVAALTKAVENVKPRIEVKAKRVGGSNYSVPVPVSAERQLTLALRWIVGVVRSGRGRKESWQVLSEELAAAFIGEGNAIKKKQDTERMAEANKAYSQFA